MSLPIIFQEAAQAELDSTVDWYEQQRAGLGAAFAIAVERILTRVANQPDFYPIISGDLREKLVHRFPDSVLYREEAGRISVVAVFHNSRDPKVWQRRA